MCGVQRAARERLKGAGRHMGCLYSSRIGTGQHIRLTAWRADVSTTSAVSAASSAIVATPSISLLSLTTDNRRRVFRRPPAGGASSAILEMG